MARVEVLVSLVKEQTETIGKIIDLLDKQGEFIVALQNQVKDLQETVKDDIINRS